MAERLDRDYLGRSRFPAYDFEHFQDNDGITRKRLNLVPRLVNSIKDYRELKAKTNYPIGTAFIIDEAQTLINSRDFMSAKNKSVIRLLSTGRVFKAYTFINLPYWENLDSQIKNYLHAVVITHRPDKSTGTSYFTPYFLKPLGYGKPPMTIRFRSIRPNGRRYFIPYVEERLPNTALWRSQDIKVTRWKEGVHQGKIGVDGSFIQAKTTLSPGQKRELLSSKAVDLANKEAVSRDNFKHGSSYSVTRIMHVLDVDRVVAEKIAFRWREMDSMIEKM